MFKELYYKYYTWRYTVPHQKQIQEYLLNTDGMTINATTLGYAKDYAESGSLPEVAVKNNVTRERVRQNLIKFARMSKQWQKRTIIEELKVVVPAGHLSVEELFTIIEKVLDENEELLPKKGYELRLVSTQTVSSTEIQYTYEVYAL